METDHRDALKFALGTTAAALLALAAAWRLSIEHPWWAAMTVWLVAQPTRGLLIERAIARLGGTAIGAAAGAVILATTQGDRAAMLVTLAAWLSFCAAGGSLFRHFRTYAFVLAGYSAAIIVLFGATPDGGGATAAWDRICCTAIGVLCSMLTSVGTPRQMGDGLTTSLEAAVGRCLDRVEVFVRTGRPPPPEPLLRAVQALDSSADDAAAGSAHERVAARRVRRISGLLLEILARTPGVGGAATRTRTGAGTVARIGHLVMLARRSAHLELATTLVELGRALPAPAREWRLGPYLATIDLRRVAHAALRPLTAFSIASAVWLASGWREGAIMVMTAALFSSLFSSHHGGDRALNDALLGSLLGVTIGAAFRVSGFASGHGLVATLSLLLPVLLTGAWFMRRPGTAKPAIDCTMAFLLIAQPLSPPSSAATTLLAAAAIVAGIAIAAATFRLFVPASAATSQRLLERRIARLVRRITAAPDRASSALPRIALRAAVLRILQVAPADRIDATATLAHLLVAQADRSYALQ